ncbi:hypothetical protein DHEL01_v207950 [Diaporthe helianthi]|uniref:Uncharacterized protein n=1 Tax=Diaporthe helianthi TaxID=158607 RepID=A0A2P5HTR7_DIAHE|nr:hypothetical protein DHEL01_v207950 [Diaporthe helianthi]
MLGGKIKESNAEADAKLDELGNRAMKSDEIEGGEADPGAHGDVELDRYSWQTERMTTGLSDDSTLAGSDSGDSHSVVSRSEGEYYGESEAVGQTADGASQDFEHTSEQYSAWNGETLPHPDSSQFVTDDVDSPGYGRPHDDAESYGASSGHLYPPPTTQKNIDYQGQHTADEYWNEPSYPDSSQAGYEDAVPESHTGESTMPPPGAYPGKGYSPAVMPDSADYLSEYRQSQVYLQQDDDWYNSASAQYGHQERSAPAGTAN